MKNDYKFAVLGTPVGHSLSPDIHKIFAEGCGIEIEYKKIDTDKQQLENTVKKLRATEEGRDFFKNNCKTVEISRWLSLYTDRILVL